MCGFLDYCRYDDIVLERLMVLVFVEELKKSLVCRYYV